MTSSLLQVKAADNLYTEELKERKKIKETLARERIESEKLKKQRDDILEELQRFLTLIKAYL